VTKIDGLFCKDGNVYQKFIRCMEND